MTNSAPLELLSADKSEAGNVRTINEDACLHIQQQNIWAVADGMGGHQSGDFASKLIMQSLSVIQHHNSLEDKISEVADCLAQVNTFLISEANHRGSNQTIGSTVVVFIAHENQAAVLWVGDSRLYRYRNGQFKQLTKDHSKVQELIDYGMLKPEDAELHPSANVITRAIGAFDPVTIDCERFEMEEGDIYLLCSDGLYKETNEQELISALKLNSSKKICDALIDTALQKDCRDNVTAIVIEARTAERTLLR